MDAAALRDAWVRKYARERSPWRGPPELGVLAPFLAGVAPGARALEVGAGSGKTLQAAPGAVAVDWARDALLALPGARVAADAGALPFRDGAFERVLFVYVLGHLPSAHRARAAREAVRVLAPGGMVLFADFALGDMRAETGAATGEPGSRLRDQGIHYHYFTREEVGDLFRGLRVEAEEEVAREQRIRGVRHERRVVRGAFRKP